MVLPNGWEVVYLELGDFHRSAAIALNLDLITVRSITNETLAGSALAAPAAGFGDFEQYPEFATKLAVLIQAVASNHALLDGNKRTALLCGVLFAQINGFRWIEPAGDHIDGSVTAGMIEGVAARTVPLGELAVWMEERLGTVRPLGDT